jgi:hypothetical protein
MAHNPFLNADGNRVNMYASTWLCTKTNDLSGSPSIARFKSRAGTMERLERLELNSERLLQLVQYPYPMDEVAMHIDSIECLSA